MKFIGITGGVGAGKSRILEYIRQHYLSEIHLADELAHQVKEPGTECFRRLVELLGEEVLDENGRIHKGRMAEKIFADPAILDGVNNIVHPAVRELILEKREQAQKRGDVELFFVEAALLIECGYGQIVDEMWYIYTREEIRRERLRKNRGYSEEKISQIMKAQLSEEEFRAGSTFVIDNSASPEESFRQIDRKLEAYTWRE